MSDDDDDMRSQLKEVNFQLLQTIADQQITEDRLNLQLTRLKLMYDFVSALNAAQTVSEIHQIALRGICPALRTTRASITLTDGTALKHQESVGIGETYQANVEAFFASAFNTEMDTDADTDTDTTVRSFPHCAIMPSDRNLQEICQREQIGAWAVFPLEYEHRHLGDIFTYFDEPRQFNEEEVQLMRTLITYIAIAITRKQAEQALRESQQFIQRIADTTPDILYIYDLEEKCNIYCNQAVIHTLGYTPSQIHLMGDRLLTNLVHTEDIGRLHKHYDHIRNHRLEDLYVIEYRMRDIYGKWKWLYIRESVFLCNAEGKVKQTIGAASDITDLKEVENRLQSSLIEKEVLLREVHHRVKNNLGMIDSLLSMQARYVTDPEALKSLSDSQRRIHTMALIHEQLHQSHDVDHVDFREYLQRLVSNLYSSASFDTNQVQLHLDLAPTFLSIDTTISMGLIVNELLTNAFKHAFPDHQIGLLEVILYRSEPDQCLHLIISDDGVGIPKSVDFNSTASLGLRLVRILSQQLRAKLDISDTLGTRFHFTFPSTSV